MSRMETVKLPMVYKARTERAVLVAYEDEDFWIPRSNLGYQTDKLVDNLTQGQEFDCIVFEWWAKSRGLI